MANRIDHDQTPRSMLPELGLHSLLGPRGNKTFFMLNSTEHEMFSAHNYENANNIWHFHSYEQRIFYAQLCLPRKSLQLLVI